MLYPFSMVITGQTYVESRKTYPITTSEDHRIITGFTSFGYNDDVIFANALKWAITNVCNSKRDNISDIKVKKNEFTFDATLQDGSQSKGKHTYYCKTTIRVMDSKLVYTIHDIEYKTSTLLTTSYNSLDELNPEKKDKHKSIINTFQVLASSMLNQLFDYINENECKRITHWDDIDIQRPVKGMNEDECYLAFGKPNSIFNDNYGRTQWSYGLNFVLIFIDNSLETILK